LNVVRNTKGSYQVSWTEDVVKASRGDYKINIYDEETFPQVRKVSFNKVDHAALILTVCDAWDFN